MLHSDLHGKISLALVCRKDGKGEKGGTGRISLELGCYFKTLDISQMKSETGPCLKRAR